METRSIVIFVLIFVVASLVAFVLYRRTSPTLPRRTRVVLGLLRWFAAFLLLAIVLAPALRIVRTSASAPSVAILVDDSKSMAYPATEAKIGAVKGVLTEGFLRGLEKKAQVRLFEFSDTAGPINLGDLAGLAATGARTDLAAGVASALDAFEGRPSAIVLVTDGATNFGEDPLHFCSTLKIPVYAISLASARPTPDLSVDRVETNETAYAGSKVPVAVYVNGRSHAGPSTLAIRDSVAEVFREQVTLSETGAIVRVVAQVDAGEVGVHSFTASLAAFDGEQVVANNSLPFSIKVIKGKLRVTLVAPRPSWDFAFARRSLEADPNMEVTVVFSPAGAVAIQTEHAVGDLARAISESDVVVVLSGAALGQAAGQLDRFVRDGRGVLLVSPDASVDIDQELNPFILSATAGTSSVTRGPRSASRSAQSRSSLYAPVPAEGGSEHQIMDVEALRGGGVWSSLPPVPVDASITAVKPQATVLLSGAISNAPVEAEAGTQPETGAPASPPAGNLPLVAVMGYGMGRAVAFAGHDLWRWDLVPKGFGVEVSAFSELLRSSVRWLAEAEETKRLALSTGKSDYLLGEPIAVLGRLSDQALKPVAGATVEARIYERASGKQVLAAGMVERTPGNYSLVADLLGPGHYLLRSVATLEGRTYAEDALTFSVSERGLEDSDFDGSKGLLEEIASSTGGGIYGPGDATKIAADFNPGSIITRTYKDFRFHLTPVSFAILSILLGTEWLIRRRKMLA